MEVEGREGGTERKREKGKTKLLNSPATQR
jgi:hypothetical protein